MEGIWNEGNGMEINNGRQVMEEMDIHTKWINREGRVNPNTPEWKERKTKESFKAELEQALMAFQLLQRWY